MRANIPTDISSTFEKIVQFNKQKKRQFRRQYTFIGWDTRHKLCINTAISEPKEGAGSVLKIEARVVCSWRICLRR